MSITKDIVNRFRAWKNDNPDEDYQYDEIHDFVSDISRGELIAFLEEIEKTFYE
jgi:hypothetical protein